MRVKLGRLVGHACTLSSQNTLSQDKSGASIRYPFSTYIDEDIIHCLQWVVVVGKNEKYTQLIHY